MKITIEVEGGTAKVSTDSPAPTTATAQNGVSTASMRRMFDAARVVLRQLRMEDCDDTTKRQRNDLRRAMKTVKAEFGPPGTLSSDNT